MLMFVCCGDITSKLYSRWMRTLFMVHVQFLGDHLLFHSSRVLDDHVRCCAHMCACLHVHGYQFRVCSLTIDLPHCIIVGSSEIESQRPVSRCHRLQVCVVSCGDCVCCCPQLHIVRCSPMHSAMCRCCVALCQSCLAASCSCSTIVPSPTLAWQQSHALKQ